MIIKFLAREEKEASLCKISSVSKYEANNRVFFIPTNPVLEDVVGIEGVTKIEYDYIIQELFEKGKVDLTSFKDRTFFMDTSVEFCGEGDYDDDDCETLDLFSDN